MNTSDVLIIGASGPIGVCTLDIFSESGLSVIGASRHTGLHVDVMDNASVAQLLSSVNPRTIVYLATPAAVELEHSPKLVARSVDALARVAQLSADSGVERLVFASSSAVYGTTEREPRVESSPLTGSGGYAESKIRAEEALFSVFGESSSVLRVLRVFNVYGPGCTQSLINRLPLKGTQVWDSDMFVRDYVHVADVAKAIFSAANYSGICSKFNVGTGVGTSNAQLISEVQRWSPIEALPYPHGLSVSIANIDLATKELGFLPVTDLRDELASMFGCPYQDIKNA